MGDYNITDIIKSKFLEEITAISIPELLIALLLSCVLSIIIVGVYRLTHSGVLYSRSFALCLVLLSMITTLVILAVSSNVVLSLGMVGALSIVRFRTAVKEPLDTVFMFWALATGIITGAGYISVAIIATLLIGLLFVILSMGGAFVPNPAYLVVIRYDPELATGLNRHIKALPKHKIKSKNLTADAQELILEMKLSDAAFAKVEALRDIEGVAEVSLISYNGATML